MGLFHCLLACLAALSFTKLGQASVGGYIGTSDVQRLISVLKNGFTIEGDDLTSVYYASLGYKLLNQQFNPTIVKDSCSYIQKNFKHDATAEVTYYALSAWSVLSCPGKLHTDNTIKNLKSILENSQSPVSEIRYSAEALSLLGQSIPNVAKIAQSVQLKLKEDDNLQNIGHAFHVSTLLGNSGKFVQEKIEDTLSQLDEIDGKLLQWEGGLSTTTLVLTGLLRLSNVKSLDQTQADKISAYLLTRKSVQTPKGVLALLEAANALSASSVAPVSFSVIGPPYVTTDKPDLKVRISDLLGRPLKPAPSPVVAQSATRLTDDVVVLSKQPLTPGTTPGEYTLPLRLEPGQYKIDLTAGSHSSTLNIRILGPVTIQSFEVGLTDADGTSQPVLTKVDPKFKLPSSLKADSSHHLIVKFTLSRPVHQSFLRLSTGKREILFVAGLVNVKDRAYKIEVDLAAELYTGVFDMELILGDFVMSNPIRWTFGAIDVNLGLTGPPKKQLRAPKPEIQHLFRPAEKRPPEVVSLVFSALTAAPLLILLILWFKIGINFGNFSILSIPFHIGLGLILSLFVCFWLKLNMFQTCAWLIPLGAFTFLSGQKLLSHMARQKKTEKAEK